MSLSKPKPWSVADFERERSYMTDWIRHNLLAFLEGLVTRRILVQAPVKSGKREMVEYIAMRDAVVPTTRNHVFLSAFYRIADKSQRAELASHNIGVFPITTEATFKRFKAYYDEAKQAGRSCVAHLDECDFGSGEDQKLKQVWDLIRDDPNWTVILYSASIEEAKFSRDLSNDGMIEALLQEGVLLKYSPPPGYCGPARFLDEGLIHDARPFIERNPETGNFALSAQGAEIIAKLKAAHATNPRRNIIILRLSHEELGEGRRSKAKKAFYQFLQHIVNIPTLLAPNIVFHMDKSEFPVGDAPMELSPRFICGTIDWSNRMFWRNINTEDLHIVILDQTSTRSTEWACHDRVFALHDYRNTITFSTVMQAQQRVNHYEQTYGGFQPILVYGNKQSFELSAERITYAQYLHSEWKKRKVTGSQPPLYRIVHTETNVTHPSYPNPLTEKAADAVLDELGCLAEKTLASRVRGSASREPIYKAEFHPIANASDDAFTAFKGAHLHSRPEWATMTFRNPFVKSANKGLADGKYKGYLRGWKVCDFDEHIVNEAGWGVNEGDHPRLTICYRGGQLGIAVRYFTNTYREESTLTAFKSMYEAI